MPPQEPLGVHPGAGQYFRTECAGSEDPLPTELPGMPEVARAMTPSASLH